MKLKIFLISLLLLSLVGCVSDATVVSNNLVIAADNFQVYRRVVFFNGITDKYLMVVEGRCSIQGGRGGTGYDELEVICKTGATSYKKHFFGLSDNVAYFVEQLEPVSASNYQYKVIFKPDVIIPDIELNTQVIRT